MEKARGCLSLPTERRSDNIGAPEREELIRALCNSDRLVDADAKMLIQTGFWTSCSRVSHQDNSHRESSRSPSQFDKSLKEPESIYTEYRASWVNWNLVESLID